MSKEVIKCQYLFPSIFITELFLLNLIKTNELTWLTLSIHVFHLQIAEML